MNPFPGTGKWRVTFWERRVEGSTVGPSFASALGPPAGAPDFRFDLQSMKRASELSIITSSFWNS